MHDYQIINLVVRNGDTHWDNDNLHIREKIPEIVSDTVGWPCYIKRQSKKVKASKKNPGQNKLKVGFWNAQSLKLKTTLVHNYIIEEQLDILFIAESWIYLEGNEKEIGELKPTGFEYDHNPRKGRRGGGVAVIFNKCTNLKILDPPKVTSMEILISSLNTTVGKIIFITVYRPESTKANRYKMENFFSELSDIISHHLPLQAK